MGFFDSKPVRRPASEAVRRAGEFSDVSADMSSIGRTDGPLADFSDVSSGSSSTAATTHETTYVVKGGDSLSRIAKRIYGDATAWPRIYEANRDKIKNPDLIYPGQEFTIPGA